MQQKIEGYLQHQILHITQVKKKKYYETAIDVIHNIQ